FARRSPCGCEERTRVSKDGTVVLVSRGIETGADIVVGEPLAQQRGLRDEGVTTAFFDLSDDPLKVLEALSGRRQRVHAVLDCHRSNALQPSADLDAQVVRLRRNLMNEQEPSSPRALRGSLQRRLRLSRLARSADGRRSMRS